jgi:hypothetical protein
LNTGGDYFGFDFKPGARSAGRECRNDFIFVYCTYCQRLRMLAGLEMVPDSEPAYGGKKRVVEPASPKSKRLRFGIGCLLLVS